METETGAHHRADGVPTGRISGVQFARQASVLGFTIETATSVGDVWTLDTGTGAASTAIISSIRRLARRTDGVGGPLRCPSPSPPALATTYIQKPNTLYNRKGDTSMI